MIRLIIACLFGLIVGLLLPANLNIDTAFSIILPVLLFSVGLSLGNIDLVSLVRNNKRFLILPILSLTGSCVFSLIYASLRGVGLKETLLAGSAMGFYSLPAIMVSTKFGALAGTLLLITNMIREAIVILLAPLLVRLFGKQSMVAVGGATTMDVSLAMIKEVAGDEYVPIAVLNGLVLTIGVPFMTSLFINLNF